MFSTIDNEIKELEAKLAELKKQKANESAILNKTGDFEIIIKDDERDIVFTGKTFQELFNFWTKKMTKNDFIYFYYLRYNKESKQPEYIEKEAKTLDEFLEIVKLIADLDAFYLTRMTFSLCSKSDKLKYFANITNEYLDFYVRLHEFPSEVKRLFPTEDAYWKKMDEGKTYRLTFNENE